MLIRIVAVGTRSPRWVDEAVADYLKRIGAPLRVELVTVRTEERTGNTSAPALMAREADRIREQLPGHSARTRGQPRARLVLLDERGTDLTTVGLAERLRQWQERADPVALVIGGPDGLDPTLAAEADESLRLSSLTLPHALARVLLAEQLYRAWSVLTNHPYHRA